MILVSMWVRVGHSGWICGMCMIRVFEEGKYHHLSLFHFQWYTGRKYPVKVSERPPVKGKKKGKGVYAYKYAYVFDAFISFTSTLCYRLKLLAEPSAVAAKPLYKEL